MQKRISFGYLQLSVIESEMTMIGRSNIDGHIRRDLTELTDPQ